MADILRVTSPVINKNIIQPDKALKDPSVPFDMQEIRHITKNPSGSGLLGHHNVLEGEAGAATLMNLLKDPAVTVNYLKNIYMLEEIINLLPVNNNTVTQEIRQLFDALLIDPDHIVDELVDQEYASTLFKGELFDLLRGILEKTPDLRMETAELLKAVNASISRQDVLDRQQEFVRYVFTACGPCQGEPGEPGIRGTEAPGAAGSKGAGGERALYAPGCQGHSQHTVQYVPLSGQ